MENRKGLYVKITEDTLKKFLKILEIKNEEK